MIYEFTLSNRQSRPADPDQPGGLAPATEVRGRLIVSPDEVRVRLEPNGIELSVLTFGVAEMLSKLPAPRPDQEQQARLPLSESAGWAPVNQADGGHDEEKEEN